ncbi:MAG: FHA domain-containing protein, partial [Anaerolineae bacterium]|nr:FHA domain-containing protein [Anaerolineae bacterium]
MKVYDCRQCPKKTMIRCIDHSPCLPEEKAEIWKAFAAGQDTETIRQFLQERCVLRQEDEERALRERFISPVNEAEMSPGAKVAQDFPKVKRPDARHLTRPLTIGQADLMPSRPTATALLQELPEVEEQLESSEALPCSLVVVSTGHRISLPAEGELILGRIDLDLSFTPDVDLTSDTQGVQSISRRHAKVAAFRGRHLIEDLGSTNGTAVNGRPLNQGQRVPLQPGDHIALGLCELTYSQTPRWLGIYRGRSYRAFFLVTFSGNRYYLPSKPEIIVGRSDPERGVTVDIDLSQEGKVVGRTSPRHAHVIEEGGLHFVEDLGSTHGSKLNGSLLEIG